MIESWSQAGNRSSLCLQVFMDASLTSTNWKNFLENSKTVYTGHIIQFNCLHKNVLGGMTAWP